MMRGLALASPSMRSFLRTALICGSLALTSLVTLAQSGPASVDLALQMKTGRAYKTGSPYCATKEYFPAEAPSNGKKVPQPARVCRDSLGRARSEVQAGALVEIYDPVEGVGYTLDTVHRRAGRTVIAQSAPPDSNHSQTRAASFVPEAPRPQIEQLGTQVIEGLVVEGTRISTPDPILAGTDQVEERWFSRELGEVILMKRSGQVLWRLKDIDRSEPNPSLFRVPANYTVEDTSDYGAVPSSANPR